MSAIRVTAIACAALALAACSVGKPIPQATTYGIEPAMPAAAPATARRPETLRMGSVQVAAAYSGSALVYRMDDVRYVADPYHAFLTEPGGMLGNRMAEWLDRAGPYKAVSQPGSVRAAPYVLEATITELYGDFRPGRAPAAVLTVQFALIDLTRPQTRVALEGTIGRRVDIGQAAPDALVRGYNSALEGVLAELASRLK